MSEEVVGLFGNILEKLGEIQKEAEDSNELLRSIDHILHDINLDTSSIDLNTMD